jgi:hypothetical protein
MIKRREPLLLAASGEFIFVAGMAANVKITRPAKKAAKLTLP